MELALFCSCGFDAHGLQVLFCPYGESCCLWASAEAQFGAQDRAGPPFTFDDPHLMIMVDGEMVLSDIATFETLARQGICYHGRVWGGVVKLHSRGVIAIAGVRVGEITPGN
jgi:hypothetical protein